MGTCLLDISLFPKFKSPLPPNKRPTTNPKSRCQFLHINSNCLWKTIQISSKSSENSKSVICRATKDVKSRKPRLEKQVKSRKPSSEKLSFSGAVVEGAVGFSQGRDEDADRLVCPGCGVFMQDKDQYAPGFYFRPVQKAVFETIIAEEEDDDLSEEEGNGEEDHLDSDKDEDEELGKIINGFEPAGPGYDQFTEEIPKKRLSEKDKKKKVKAERKDEDMEMEDEFFEVEDLKELTDEKAFNEFQEEWRKNPKGKGFREETPKVRASKKGRKNKTVAKEATLETLVEEAEEVDEDEFFEEEDWSRISRSKDFKEETIKGRVSGKNGKKHVKAEREEEEDDDEIFGEEDEDGGVNAKEEAIDWGWSDLPSVVDEEEEWRKKLEREGFAPAGPGFGNVTEETLKARALKREMIKKARAEQKEREEGEMVVVCARCHSLRYYGNVKDQSSENLLPEFDFESAIGSRLMKSSGVGRTVVIMVVDVVDFDGSFPRRAAIMLNNALRKSRGLRLVLAATKADLLPGQISPARLDRWVRIRARAAGAPKLSGAFMVSAHRDLGVRNLIAHIKELAGPRGNVWVIGAQNAGKSTLINAIGKKEAGKVTHLTEAAVPGTTLGIMRIGGILPAKAKLYDTPGLLHPYQMTMRLNREEQKMTEIRKQLKPRTYRVKVGQAIHIGGLIRLDVDQASVETIYVTIWVSVHVSLHLGKVETANDIKEKHFGVRLQPPIGEERVRQLGEWKQNKIKVSGNSWDVNSVDVAAAGIGWFSLGLKGDASLSVWTYDGVDITVREPLVLDRAPSLERPGFLLSKAVTEAISEKSKINSNDSNQRKKKKSKTGNIDDLRIEMLLEEELANA